MSNENFDLKVGNDSLFKGVLISGIDIGYGIDGFFIDIEIDASYDIEIRHGQSFWTDLGGIDIEDFFRCQRKFNLISYTICLLISYTITGAWTNNQIPG